MEIDSNRPGTILKIKLADFVSYSRLSFKPSQLVNIILAPNGAGKSSLLSAIILGLGGKPAIIGKSSQIQDYIMYGKDEGKIRIDLYDPLESDGVLSVCRAIKRNGSSTWILNKKRVGLKQIEDVMQRLNIQVNSLCQILPQERVQDFAKMNSLELLENVQKVMVGDLFSNYTELIELRRLLDNLKTTIDAKTVVHQNEVAKYTRLEKDVDAIREKMRVLKSVTNCRQKLAWTQYKKKEEEQNKVNEYLSEAKIKLQNFEKELEPLKKSIQKLDSKFASSSELVKTRKNKVNIDKEKLRRTMNTIRMANDQIEHIKETLSRKISNLDNIQSQISDAQIKINELTQQLATENVNGLTEQVKQFDSDIKEKMCELQSLVVKENTIKHEQVALNNSLRMLESKLEKANSVSKKRLNMISSRNQDVYKGYMWLNENNEQFEATIYGPILLEINISEPQGAKYIEFIINYRDLISFVTETAQDTTNLLSILRDRDKLTINCAHCSPPEKDFRQLYSPNIPLEQIRQLGFDYYLIDLLDGPPTVLKHLSNLYKLHLIPVAFNPESVNKAAIDKYVSCINRYFIGDEFFRVTKTKYSSNLSTSVKKIRAARLLADSLDKELISHIQQELWPKREALSELANEVIEISENRNFLQTKLNDLRNEKRSLAHKLEQVRSTTVRLRRCQEESISLQSMIVDVKKEEMDAKNKIKSVLNSNRPMLAEVLEWTKAYFEDSISYSLASDDCEAIKQLRDNKASDLSQHEEDKEKYKSKCEELRRCLTEVKAEAASFFNKAKELTDGLVMGEPKFARLFEKAFSHLPNDIEDIKNKIHSFEAKAKCLEDPLQEQHLRDYETAKEAAENLNIELQKLIEDVTSAKEKFNSLLSIWLPQIDNVVQHINCNFSKFFQKISCVGEVSLNKSDNQEAVEKFGLEIRVKFRNDSELQILDQYVQSGGERALTTAVFLLSLQRLSSLPFRCVDEINQGMDQFNERRVYNLLFNTISDSSSQYFLLTPKFLPNVPFPRICTIFNLYNSHSIGNSRGTLPKSVTANQVLNDCTSKYRQRNSNVLSRPDIIDSSQRKDVEDDYSIRRKRMKNH